MSVISNRVTLNRDMCYDGDQVMNLCKSLKNNIKKLLVWSMLKILIIDRDVNIYSTEQIQVVSLCYILTPQSLKII